MGFLSNYDNKRSIKKLQKIANKIDSLEDKYLALSDAELKEQTNILKARLKAGETLDQILPDAFAVVREASTRVLKMRHFNVQLLGGIVLHQGRISEMKTGEGKTLVSTLPAYLNALSGKPVHIVTVNEYLAKRDAEWMGKIHKFLGLSVGVIYSGQPKDEKQKAYAADITYGTNSEFGFDYLRDNMEISRKSFVQRGNVFAIIDEVDSILIDEARTPLIISGPSGESSEQYSIANKFAKSLSSNDYVVDEKERTVTLTETGISKAERYYSVENLSDIENTEINHNINNAIRACFLMKKDSDYIVANGEVLIVDEFTGRILVGRRYSNGLHQAVEAKENVKVKSENKTYATITLQNYFKLYEKISGMTGTAKTEEGEFREIYGLDVVVIPTNVPMIRKDETDAFYFSHQAKINAIVKDIEIAHEKGQPVLVGTITVEKSEELSKILSRKKIKHNVLNAKNHMREAEIVAQAGTLGSVTIATNMAGRGTDIMLGGNAEFLAKQELVRLGFADEIIEKATSYVLSTDDKVLEAKSEYEKSLAKHFAIVKEEKKKVIELGGLRIVGTERHESRRIDNQLRGRAGRQGDPGSSIFYLSADDELSRVFGSERLKKMAQFLKLDEETSIRWKFFSRGVENAQKKVENRNYSIRKSVVEFDNVLNKQREEIYSQRNKILDGEDIHPKVLEMIKESVENVVFENFNNFDDVRFADITAFNNSLERKVLEQGTNFITHKLLEDNSEKEVVKLVTKLAVEQFEKRIEEAEKQGANFKDFERSVVLRVLDKKWIEHIDDMDTLRQGIGLRGYGNQNPVLVYKKEGFEMFDHMVEEMRKELGSLVLSVRFKFQTPGTIKMPIPNRRQVAGGGIGTVKNTSQAGRNDPCPCGSGKKFKNCCGRQL